MLDRKTIEGARRKQPDKMGEEGKIYFFGKPDHPLVLKEWYRRHEHTAVENALGKRVPISPFHHKASYYELRLAHELFPEHTVGVMGGADPRLSSGPDGEPQFDPAGPTPVTVLRRELGDPALLAQYDAIIDEAYTVLLRQGEDLESARTAMDKADTEITRLFGKELADSMTLSNAWTNPNASEAIDEALKYANGINPNSIVVQLLEHGIIPTHPTFNFVPRRAEPTSPAPHGTFLELQIIDQPRLAKKIAQHPHADQLRKLLKRYQVFNTLDVSYRSLLKFCDQALIDDPVVQKATFDTLRVMQGYLELPLGKTLPTLDCVSDCVEIGKAFGQDRAALLEALKAYRQDIKDELKKEQFVREVNLLYTTIRGLANPSLHGKGYEGFLRIMKDFMVGEHQYDHIAKRGAIFLAELAKLKEQDLDDAELAAAFERIGQKIGTAV